MPDLIKCSGPQIYLLEGDTIRHIASPRVFKAWNYHMHPVKKVTDGRLKDFRKGLPIVLGPGERVSIIVLTFNELKYTKMCLDSLVKYTGIPFELIIVDNGSTDGTGDYLKQFRSVIKDCPLCMDYRTIFNRKNRGFAAGNNQGIRVSTGRYVVLLNNDTVLTPNWLVNLVYCGECISSSGIIGPRTNAVASKQLIEVSYKDLEEMQRFARSFNRTDSSRWFQVDRLSAFCFVIKREVIDSIGLLDERFQIGIAEDDDYCIRARKAGYLLYCAGDTFIHHFRSRTFIGNGIDRERIGRINHQKLKKKWGRGG